MKHKIYVKNKVPEKIPRVSAIMVRRVIKATLACEGVDAECEVSVLVTDDAGIRAINREFRGIDEATDILSFPSFKFKPGAFDASDGETDAATGLLPLGDIVLSAERVNAQAAELGHSPEREATYLVIHSVLHLLGYDHPEEGEDIMRAREREVLELCGFIAPI
ncbi:MAG: rRNA maturation RNase YbeY [Oscillospiraceae bacterium]|jgi:probable rRNA maturation factor|nr:rRNA maturation RNase YbeY [Oscillospiraceae bacterium]